LVFKATTLTKKKDRGAKRPGLNIEKLKSTKQQRQMQKEAHTPMAIFCSVLHLSCFTHADVAMDHHNLNDEDTGVV
jgi:hypothetical protein